MSLPSTKEPPAYRLREGTVVVASPRLPSRPKVSVWMVTYNHEKFIAEAIDSILAQQTTFDFELVIGEDCSTDNTRQIVLDYQKKHPDKICVVLQPTNSPVDNTYATYATCHGEYIAMCEGDDYWTDPEKLQVQAAFLDEHPDVVACGGRYQVLDSATNTFLPDNLQQFFNGRPQLVTTYDNFMYPHVLRTLAVAFRKSGLSGYFEKGRALDVALWAHLMSRGQHGVVLNRVFGVYRHHGGGMWSSIGAQEQQRFSRKATLVLASNEGLASQCIRKYFIQGLRAQVDQARQTLLDFQSDVGQVRPSSPSLSGLSATGRFFHTAAFRARDAYFDIARLQLQSIGAMHDASLSQDQRVRLRLRQWYWLAATFPLIVMHALYTRFRRRRGEAA